MSVTFLLIKALKQPDIFVGIQHEDEELLLSNKAPEAHSVSESDQLAYRRIHDFIAEKKSYLDPRLSISQLAKQIKLPAREVSRLVNLCSERNFSDFVNHFRVKHACKAMQVSVDDKRKLLDVLLSSGFSSKSSFNALFKKEMKMTPSQFRLKIQSHK